MTPGSGPYGDYLPGEKRAVEEATRSDRRAEAEARPRCPKCDSAPGEMCRYEGPCIWLEDDDDVCHHGVPFCDYCEWCDEEETS